MTPTLASIRREIRENWRSIVDTSGVYLEAKRHLPKVPKLLGSSFKTEKGEGYGILSAVVYLAPADRAFIFGAHSTNNYGAPGKTLCVSSTEECRATCLGHSSGRMVMDNARKAQLWKTALYMGARHLFVDLAILEARAFAKKARAKGLTPAIRFDGSSDTGVGRIVARHVHEAEFYDYTKVFSRLTQERPTNYHLTFSYSGSNASECHRALKFCLANVAVVFDTSSFPKEFMDRKVIDGDITDARFNDPINRIVGLRFKTARKRSEQILTAGSFVEVTQ